MRQNLVAFIVGLLFAIGLGVSGMTDPQKVLGFLDFFGAWDPSLAFVMVGAIGSHALFYRWAKQKPSPVMAPDFHIPTRRDIDFRLIVGSIIFGLGWGIGGYCPGPALTSLLSMSNEIVVFVPMMLVGMWLARQSVALLDRSKS